MPAPLAYAMQQALGVQSGDPVRDRAAAARAALDNLVGSMAGPPLANVDRTPAPVIAAPSVSGGGGYAPSGGGGLQSGAGAFGPRQVALVGALFGLRPTSGYRSPAHNAAVGGVPNSRHLSGRAQDFVGSSNQMRAAAAWAKSNGATEVLIHNAGSGTHLHIGW